MDAAIWRLPGPSAYVDDLSTELRRGRHVAAVLPAALCSDPGFSDTLAVALIDQLNVEARRVHGGIHGKSILDSVPPSKQ